MPYKYHVQDKKRIRVIIDTDAACEADDPYAIVQGLLTPRFIVEGIIAEQFSGYDGNMKSVELSIQVINHILKLLDKKVPVYAGAIGPIEDEKAGCKDGPEAPESPAADFIIEQALKVQNPESNGPDGKLYILCQGAITNVAIALNKCPEIADKIIVVWIGGGVYPEGGWEFNLTNDYLAANVVFNSKAELWQVPMNAYTQMQISYAELEDKVYPCGEIGKWLFEELQEHGKTAEWITGESWALGDNPAIGLALNPGCGHYEMKDAPLADKKGFYVGTVENRKIRVYHHIDSRFIFEDLFAKLRLNSRK